MEKVFNSIVAVIATFFTYLFGGWDIALIVLVAFMVLDYATGMMWAYIQKTLNSQIGFRGCYFYIANEGISLLENVSHLGLPIPDKLKNALQQLNEVEK